MFLLLLFLPATILHAETVLTILHFADYHAHAVPFREGGHEVGGIARLIGFLKPFARRKDTLIFSGGDMLNAGSPSWSDKYQCAEWPWLNGIVDAMAFGNHDADYGPEVFQRCRQSVRFPILAANLVRPDGAPVFGVDGKDYLIFRRGPLRIGVFAVDGSDFGKLVPPAHRPLAGAEFTDSTTAARRIVTILREKEKANLVVLIGHEHTEDDMALARSVPGIDLILGTHSHRKQPLQAISGTKAYMISPYQYGNFVSRVDLRFAQGRLIAIDGRLVPMNEAVPEDASTKKRVAIMEDQLERDPLYRDFFVPIGSASTEISTTNGVEGESLLGDFVTDLMRASSKSDIAVSAASSFRQSLPEGPLRMEDLRASMPYDNSILVYRMTGSAVRKLIAYSLSRRGSDFFSQVSGLRFKLDGSEVRVAHADGSESPLRDEDTYTVATTDYQGRIATGYKEIFGAFPAIDSGMRVRSVVEKRIHSSSPVTATLDRRIQ